jgi:tetratricopeptide (TPR) repeat protein
MDDMLRALERPPRTRTGLALAMVAGVLAIVLGGRVGWAAHTTAQCEREAESLRAWWKDASTSAEAGLLATDVDYAAQTWGVARPRVDAFVDAWTEARAQTCGEDDPERASSVRACLDERSVVLETLAGIWSAATPQDVAAVASAAALLPPLAICSDPITSAPRDEAEGSARAELFRADAARIAGHYRDAAAIAESLEAAAVPSDIRASAAVLLARVASDEGDFPAVERHLRAAFVRALAAGRNDIAGDAASRLAAHFSRLRSYDDHAEWAAIARAALTQAHVPDSDPRVLALVASEATVASSRGDVKGALVLRREALAGLIEVFGEDHPDILRSRTSLAIDLMQDFQWDAGTAEFRDVLRRREALLGPDHPTIAETLHNLGNALTHAGDVDAAIAAHERAYRLVTAHYGEHHPLTVATIESLGWAHMGARPDPAAALPYFERALVLQRQLDGKDSYDTARILDRRGQALVQLGRPEEGERDAREGLAMLERMFGSEHLAVSYPLEGVAGARSKLGDPEGARVLLERALRIRGAALGDDHPDVNGLRIKLAAL